MNSLQKIQKISKLGQILSKIVFILCIVGAVGCVVGIIGLIFVPDGYTLGKLTIHSVVEKTNDVSIGTCYAALAVAAIFCIGEVILAKIAENYFTHELAAGTPFTLAGAKEMLRLGIFTVCIPILSAIVAAIAYANIHACFDDVKKVELSNSLSIGLGVMFIVMSVVCRYGAELREQQTGGETVD